jgi:hypothetical protein
MKKGIIKRLDEDAFERRKVLALKYNSQHVLDPKEIFSGHGITAALANSSIVLRGFNLPRILTSIPLYGTVAVTICPACPCVKTVAPARPVFASGAIVPILIAPYASYRAEFVSELLKFPHINAYEFDIFRATSLVAQADGVVCNHCVERKREKLLVGFPADSELTRAVHDFFQSLTPFVNPDYELIEEMESAVGDNDARRILQLADLADTINSIRTSQAFFATTNVPFEQLQSLPKGTVQERLIRPLSSDEVKRFVAEELGLLLPKDMAADRYLEVVMPHRDRLSRLIGDIVNKPGTNSLQPVIETVETINDEIRSAQGKTRFLAYRAAVGLASGNQALIGSVLVGGALAAAGHLGLCTASAAIGVGLKTLGKLTKLKGRKDYQDAGRAVVRDLQPPVAKVLAKYLGITARAVEVWQLREQLIGDAQGVAMKVAGGAPIKKRRTSGPKARRRA